MTDELSTPRVFMSYSWTTTEHVKWVVSLAERLVADGGVEVILDHWDLKEGSDKYTFMERMVTDHTLSKVLIICDKRYAEKADAGEGGVGTESQIIRQDLYEKVDQEKFIPIIRERDKDGHEYVPVYLRNRKYIDFSNDDDFEQSYVRLIRNIFGKPERIKPALGKPPTHLLVDFEPIVRPASVDSLVRGLSCKAVFAPVEGQYESANIVRNAAKIDAIRRSIKAVKDWNRCGGITPQPVIWIVAEAGPAYLSTSGVFHAEVLDFVAAGGLLRVLLTAPWGIAGAMISKSYHEPTSIDPISGRHLDLMSKYEASLRGCVQLTNLGTHGKVEMRICDAPLPCTLLVTVDRVFFEPYVYSNRNAKLKRRFDTFELEFERKSPEAVTVWTEHLQFLWCCVGTDATRWLMERQPHEDGLIDKLQGQCERSGSSDRKAESIPLISEHDTWISLDPLVGCPACCRYCFVRAAGMASQRPIVRCSPEELIHKLVNYMVERKSGWEAATSGITPICIGNYTDMLMSKTSRNYLLKYAELHSWHLPDFPLCIITKCAVPSDFLQELNNVGCLILLFLSQSFMNSQGYSDVESGNICLPRQTVEVLHAVRGMKNIVPIHFWRPITPQTVPSVDIALEQLAPLKEAGCLASVAVGVKCGPGVGGVPDGMAGLVESECNSSFRGEFFPKSMADIVFETSRRLSYPVFRNTSCAVALALKMKESLGTWVAGPSDDRCAPCLCPEEQRRRCESARPLLVPPSNRVRTAVAKLAEMSDDKVIWNPTKLRLEVAGKVRQDLHSKLVHLTGIPIKPSDVQLIRAWPGWILME